MESRLESELKYRAETDGPLDALARQTSLGPAALGPGRVAGEVDRYLDTADRRLGRARWACRLRTRLGRTIVSLKGPAQHRAGASMHVRPELEGPATADLDPSRWPQSPAREKLLDLSGGAPLTELLTLDQRRTEREVRLDNQRVGHLSLDRARVLHRGRELDVLRVVELELDLAALDRGLDPAPLERALDGVNGLTPDPASKLERALALIGETPA